jgi:hypothetical protein
MNSIKYELITTRTRIAAVIFPWSQDAGSAIKASRIAERIQSEAIITARLNASAWRPS